MSAPAVILGGLLLGLWPFGGDREDSAAGDGVGSISGEAVVSADKPAGLTCPSVGGEEGSSAGYAKLEWLSAQETADALQTSLRTVERDWTRARAWLREELGGTGPV